MNAQQKNAQRAFIGLALISFDFRRSLDFIVLQEITSNTFYKALAAV